MQFYPGILTDSVSDVAEKITLLQNQSSIETVHIDVIDGFFADNITVAPLDIAALDFGDLKCDLHLMVDEPMDFLFEAESIKDRLPVRAVIAQLEHMSYQRSFIEEVRVNQWRAGLALNIHTPVDAIDDVVWADLDIIQIMAVEAGASGQNFQDQALEKIKEIAALAADLRPGLEIIVDGGVSLPLLEKLRDAGASSIVVTSDIWLASDPTQAISDFVRLA